jgi:hypothetical protein
MSQSISSVGANAFKDCKHLPTLVISDNVSKKVPDVADPTKEVWETNMIDTAFSGCDSIVTLTAPASAISFLNNANIASVIITKGDIDESAFVNSQALNMVTIKDSVTSIGARAFYSCSNLMTVNANNAELTVGVEAFKLAQSLTTVNMPNAMIEKAAFERCVALSNVSIGTGARENIKIAEKAFFECENLTKVVIGKNVVSIGAEAFKQTALTNVDFEIRIGWKVVGVDKKLTLWSTNLAEPDVAAQFLVDDYCGCDWNLIQ